MSVRTWLKNAIFVKTMRMKKLILCIIIVFFGCTGRAQAQRLVIGEKAPEIKVGEWLGGREPALSGKVFLVDFFHSSNDQCVRNLKELQEIHNRYGSKLNVILVARESLDKISPHLSGKGYGFYMGIDDQGKTFNGYSVRFVPFAALVDARGRLIWTGNVSGLSNDIIDKATK